jgi:hypothetical protein
MATVPRLTGARTHYKLLYTKDLVMSFLFIVISLQVLGSYASTYGNFMVLCCCRQVRSIRCTKPSCPWVSCAYSYAKNDVDSFPQESTSKLACTLNRSIRRVWYGYNPAPPVIIHHMDTERFFNLLICWLSNSFTPHQAQPSKGYTHTHTHSVCNSPNQIIPPGAAPTRP